MEEFTIETAVTAAKNGELETWLYAFLEGPGNNGPMARGLQLQERWWIGPIQFSFDYLRRCCGPEPGMEYWIADVNAWESRIQKMVSSLERGWEPVPLVVEYRSGTLWIRDGSHRFEALQRNGHDHYWVIFWFNCAEDKTSFLEEHMSTANSY